MLSSYARLIDLGAHPCCRGPLQGACITHEDENPLCGDRIHIYVEIDAQGRLSAVSWEGDGCLICLASSDLLAQAVQGHTLEEAHSFSEARLLALVGVPLNRARRHCALLPLKVLQTALDRFDFSQRPFIQPGLAEVTVPLRHRRDYVH